MSPWRVILHLAQGDLLRSRRDLSLAWLLLGPWINALLFAYLLPRLAWLLKDDLALLRFYPWALAFLFLWLAPVGLGQWSARLLLEERLGGFRALAVLPISRSGFFAYRLWLPGLLAYFTVLGCLLLASPDPLPIGPLALISLLAALQTPLAALLLSAFFQHPAQSLALARLVKLLGFLTLSTLWLPFAFHNLLGLVFAPYWVFKAFWMAQGGAANYWQHLIVGALFLLPLLGWAKGRFLRQFDRALRA
jgi:fluoroquinolone transport system permease protein